MRRMFSDASYDFIGWRKRAYVASGALILMCLVAAIYWQVKADSWIKYGVDFSGGSVIQIRFDQPQSAGTLRDVLQPALPGTEITNFGDQANEFLARVPESEGPATTGVANDVERLLGENFGAGTFEIVRVEAVGAKVGGELQTKAILAILLSFAATLIYLAFRFEWRFGTAALIATFHDVILTLGFISFLRLEVGLSMVAAVLTIVGYSLNDTIVIFDRIRENLRNARRDELTDVLNRSINETLPRTLLTSGTTLATLVSLFMFGGIVIREFALILIIGIVMGTYSSIFVASPALLEIEKRWPRGTKKKKTRSTRARAGVTA